MIEMIKYILEANNRFVFNPIIAFKKVMFFLREKSGL
jgi:hypothetical protein